MVNEMFSEMIQTIETELSKEGKWYASVLGKLEDSTGVKRLYSFGGLVGILSIYLIIGHFAELVCNFLGMAYPACASILAIQSTQKDDVTQWLTYWVVFELFTLLDFFAECILNWFPFYWLGKFAFLLWLYFPRTMGAQRIYKNQIEPLMLKYGSATEADINAATAALTQQALLAAAGQAGSGGIATDQTQASSSSSGTQESSASSNE